MSLSRTANARRIPSLLPVLLLCLLASGCIDREQFAIDRYVDAYLLQEKGLLDEAMTELSKASDAKPDFASAHSLRGDILYKQGRMAEAAESYEKAIRIDQNDLLDHYHLGIVYKAMDRLMDAVKVLARATQIEPQHFGSQYQLGEAYQGLGRYKEAAERFLAAIRLDPKHAPSHHNLAACYTHLAKPEDAIREYKDAIERGADTAQIWIDLGKAYVQTRNYRSAIDAFGRARKHDPRSLEVIDRLAYSHYQLGEPDDAEALYRELLRRAPGSWRARTGLGLVLMSRYLFDRNRRDLHTQAIRLWEDSLARNADQPQIRALLARYRNLPQVQIDPRTGLPRDPRHGG
jgi:tetratricopeptide (TPR) repeat protein